MQKTSLLLIASAILMAACGSSKDSNVKLDTRLKPAKPIENEMKLNLEVPYTVKPLPVSKHISANSDKKKKYLKSENPIINILYGFEDIWSLNNHNWQNGGAHGAGPSIDKNETIYNTVEIRDPKVWEENIAYVVKVTNDRTEEQALEAYYDDRRSKNLSVLDGFGPLTEEYKKASGAKSSMDHSSDGFDVNKEITYKEGEKGSDGDKSSKLGSVVNLVGILRESHASTSGSKYFYSSPRPWRMNNKGQVIGIDANNDGNIDLETIGNTKFEKYESDVKVVPALKYARRKAFEFKSDGKTANGGRGKDGGYPSGHTNAGYLASYAYAYAMPERFQEMLTRASELGNNRIVAGMHSPLDVIGGRTQSTAVSGYAFANAENIDAKTVAYEATGNYFGKLAEQEGLSLYEYAHKDDKTKWADHDKNKELYRFRMTYGLSKTGESGIAPIIPEGAESILETKLPYLTADQRREVLYTTALDSGYLVLDSSNGWGRLDYVMAADGYGAFLTNVDVDMDASKGRFNAKDWWRNDISGKGMLTKAGTGTLILTGDNSYKGGTLIESGTLSAESATALGKGSLYVEDKGTVLVDAEGTVRVGSTFTLDGGTLAVEMDNDSVQLSSQDIMYIDGGTLNLDFSEVEVSGEQEFIVVSAKSVIGKFDNIVAGAYDVELEYLDNGIIAKVEAK